MKTSMTSSQWPSRKPVVCGVTIRLGARHSGESGGNGSTPNTSSEAPPSAPDASAATSAASSSSAPRDVHEVGAPRQQRQPAGVEQRLGVGGERRRQYHGVARGQQVVDPLGAPHGHARRSAQLRAAPQAGDAHAERHAEPRHGLTNGAQPDDAEPAAMQLHRQPIALELVLRPGRRALPLERQRQVVPQREQRREHVLGDRAVLHAAGVGDHDAARRQFGQAEREGGDGGGMHPAQVRGRRDLLWREAPRAHHLGPRQPGGARLGRARIEELVLRTGGAQPHDLFGRQLPGCDRLRNREKDDHRARRRVGGVRR